MKTLEKVKLLKKLNKNYGSAYVLYDVLKSYNDKVIYITQEDLLLLTGFTRPTIKKCFATLEKAGLIKSNYGRVEVL